MKINKTYAGIPEKFSKIETAKIVLVPVSYDGTSTWQKGADKGPSAFLEASENMELYDIETNSEVYKKGIYLSDSISDFDSPDEMIDTVYKITKKYISKNKFVTIFGGEHSISIATVKAFNDSFDNLSVLHIDAHADLRDSYNGEKFSHASAIRRCLDYKNVSVISFGIRNISKSEIPYLQKNKSRINIFWAKDKSKWDLRKFKKLIKNKTVYLTFDVDGFDSSIMPATGTPEPGGLLWDETLNIIKVAAKNSNIVGADINELAPIRGFNSYNFLVAKLAYNILSYKFLI